MSQRVTAIPTGRMTRAEYLAWCEQQPRGRFERLDGRVVAMAPERSVHALVKANAWQALRAAVRAAQLPCQVFPDGMTVAVGEHTDYEPDVVVQCGERVALESVFVSSPLIVVEVESPSTLSTDMGVKLSGYFRVPSVRHSVIVRTRRRGAIHHRREGKAIATSIVAEGALIFDPPGVQVDLAAFYDDVEFDLD